MMMILMPYSSVLHRYPVVTPDPLPWEIEFAGVQEKIAIAQRAVRI